MQKVKFFDDGKWADGPRIIFDVSAGEVREVSDGLARIVQEAKKGEYVFDENTPEPEPEPEPEKADSAPKKKRGRPPATDKAMAEHE